MNNCKICNKELGDIPTCFGSNTPASIIVPESEYDQRVLENDDQCIIDDEYFFVRGHIELPVLEINDVFIWSAWVSLSKDNFKNMNLN